VPSGKNREVSDARPRTLITDVYRGHGRLTLIRDIALGEFTFVELARRYGLDSRTIETFSQDFASEIAEVRAALAGHLAVESAGLWVAKKQNRIAELQDDIEDCNTAIASMRVMPVGNEGYESGLGSRRHMNIARTKLNALVAVANELGPLEKRAGENDSDKNMIHYVIEADDTIRSGLT
jgi:hypothetical protein